jgi:nitric oxide reductase subunit C
MKASAKKRSALCAGLAMIGLASLVILTQESQVSAAGGTASPAATTPVGRADVGAKLFDRSDCRNCHSVNHQGSEVGPDLTQISVRRSRDWLVAFIYDPEEQFPDTKMPRFPWKSKQDVADIVAFLQTLKNPVDRDAIRKTSTSPLEIGKALVAAFDCRACHIIQDGGRPRYPNLTHIGSKIYPEWEQEWLRDPQKIKPGTFMPTFGFTENEAKAIATYLDSLK